MNWVIRSTDAFDTEKIGRLLGEIIKEPEVIELISDLGGGKTTFVKGFASGMGSTDKIGSPTFTIVKVYRAKGLQIHHFDFYRLKETGLISAQLKESLASSKVITLIEWSNLVENILPPNRISLNFKPVADNPEERILTFNFPPSKLPLIERLRTKLSEIKP